MAGVYEYARSCPWVWPGWQKWLDETIDALNYDGTLRQFGPPCIVRDMIRAAFYGESPLWETTDELARVMDVRAPTLLRRMSLLSLAYCTPSFPACWYCLPEEEKRAALSLLPGSLPAFGDVDTPKWSAPHACSVAVDFGADVGRACGAFEKWFTAKKAESPGGLRVANSRWNPGRSAAPRREALTWLVAFRFWAAGISDSGATSDIKWWKAKVPDPRWVPRFPRLPNVGGMTRQDWSRLRRKARGEMVDIFTPRVFPIQATLPRLRWKPVGL